VTDQRPGELYAYTYNKRNRMVSVSQHSSEPLLTDP
jgi:hypothetical protein